MVKNLVKLDYACSKIALLFVSKRKTPGTHFNIMNRLKKAIAKDSDNVGELLLALDKERAKRKFKVTRANFYWIRKELNLILSAQKDMQQDYAERLDAAITRALEMFLNDLDAHTKK